jgi:ERCC4-type nuclease
MVGVERKTIGDLVASITSGRFSGHQLIGLLNTYNAVYVVVEGLFRPNPNTGVLETFKRGKWSALLHGRKPFLYSMVANFLATITNLCGITVIRTGSDNETVHAVLALYHWWNDKKWSEHGSHLAMYTPPQKHITRIKPPLVAKVAAQLDGIEWTRAHQLAGVFPTVVEFANTNEQELKRIPGIGDKLSASIIRQLQGSGI